jgi:hypothetical protein
MGKITDKWEANYSAEIVHTRLLMCDPAPFAPPRNNCYNCSRMRVLIIANSEFAAACGGPLLGYRVDAAQLSEVLVYGVQVACFKSCVFAMP